MYVSAANYTYHTEKSMAQVRLLPFCLALFVFYYIFSVVIYNLHYNNLTNWSDVRILNKVYANIQPF